MWLILIASALCLASGTYFFLRLRNRSERYSGLMIKYEELLKPLTAEKRIHVDEKGISNLTLNFQEAKSRTTFALYEIENKLFVSWSYNSKGIGQRGKEWCFKQDSCQQKMYLQIRQDIETCLRSISI